MATYSAGDTSQAGGGDWMGSVIKKRRKKISRHKYRKMRKKMRWDKKH